MEGSNAVNSILNKIKGKSENHDIIDVYHRMMTVYGWFPIREFWEMDASLGNNLIEKINKDAEAERKAMAGKK